MKLAFYAPMKPPCHPVPSGDRAIARLTLRALKLAGCAPETLSTLRVFDAAGSPAAQADLTARARAEAERLIAALRPDPPAAWLTYHCHYKAPDLIGPAVAQALEIPYLVAEPSISPRRRHGPWARFARASEAALARADRLFWTTARDLPALLAAGHGDKLVHLPAFLDPGPPVPPRAARAPLRLLAVGMMRPGAKVESWRRLAAGLERLDGDWELTAVGGGGESAAVRAMLRAASPRAARVRFLGTVDNPETVRAHCEAHDLLVWPGVDEGVGMVWLEAQAAGLPVVAEDGPAARAALGVDSGRGDSGGGDSVRAAPGGRLAPPDDPAALAAAVRDAAARRAELSAGARAHIEARHAIGAAAAVLRRELDRLTR